MKKLYIDTDRYVCTPASPLVEAIRNAVTDLVRQRYSQSGRDWRDFVFDDSDTLIGRADFEAIERSILDTGHRFRWSAVISQKERPDAYLAADSLTADDTTFSFEHTEAVCEGPDANGRQLRGQGENVVRHPSNTVGIARYLRSSKKVLQFMRNGVPAETIAIIDDSGGTLTAPILEKFKGIICAGGTIRSHLGILSREYGIPCLMNAKLRDVHEGDAIELETAAEATTAESYFTGQAKVARIWKLPPPNASR